MLPFTAEQFLAVFAGYNAAVWPAQLVAYGLGAVAVALALRPSTRSDRVIAATLAVMWAWTGVAYHMLHFAAINAAAPVFGALFVAQALLLLHFGIVRSRLRFGSGARLSAPLGWALVVYASVAYPLIGIATGHGDPELPMFGITPCPVTIFTLGMILLTTAPVPKSLLAVPAIWSLVGGSAAFLLGIAQDWPLIVSGLVVAPLVLVRNRRMPA